MERFCLIMSIFSHCIYRSWYYSKRHLVDSVLIGWTSWTSDEMSGGNRQSGQWNRVWRAWVVWLNLIFLQIITETLDLSFYVIVYYSSCSDSRNDLDRLEYLTQCIKEGMRLHSPVPGILRENQAPIKVDNHVIPTGSCLTISIYCLHHNPTVWGQDHMDFRPERFSKENVRKMDPFAYCPFSAGPRYNYYGVLLHLTHNIMIEFSFLICTRYFMMWNYIQT